MNSFVTMTPPMGGRFEQISNTGSPIPRPASATASAASYGSPRVGGDAYRSSPKPHSSPKMKLRFRKLLCFFFFWNIYLFSKFNLNFFISFIIIILFFNLSEQNLFL